MLVVSDDSSIARCLRVVDELLFLLNPTLVACSIFGSKSGIWEPVQFQGQKRGIIYISRLTCMPIMA